MKKVFCAVLAAVMTLGCLGCSAGRTAEETFAETAGECKETVIGTEKETESTVPIPETTEQMIHCVNITSFLTGFNQLLAAWEVPFVAELSEESYVTYQSRYAIRLCSLTSEEVYSDRYHGGLGFQGWIYAVHQGEKPIYKVDFTCFDGAGEELNTFFPKLCAAASLAMDPELTPEDALGVFDMAHTYQSESFTYNWYETGLCSHVISWSPHLENPIVANRNYTIKASGLLDYENGPNTFAPLDPELLEYKFNFDPCGDDAVGMVFDSYGYLGYLSGSLYDLCTQLQLWDDPETREVVYFLKDRSGGSEISLSPATFSLQSVYRSSEGGECFIRLRCNPGNLANEPLSGTGSALESNPQHLLRPAICLLQLCDAGMGAREAIDLCTGKAEPALVLEDGTQIIQYCSRNAMILIRYEPSSGALDITICTKSYFEKAYGSLDGFLEQESAATNG